MTSATRRLHRVLIVDDHPLVVTGLRDALAGSTEFEVVGAVATESEAVRVAAESKPDLAIVDMALSRGSGLGVIKLLHAQLPAVRMLVFTMHDEALYAERAVRSGASGFLNKSASADDLLAALRDVADGKTAISEQLNDRLVQRALGRGGGEDAVESLSDRELEIFEHIGRGRSLKSVGAELGISVKTVETHRENIKRKLELNSASELARFATIWTERST